MLQRNVLGVLRTFFLAAAVLTAGGGVMAQGVDDAQLAYRAHVLAALEAHIQAIGDVVDGKVAYWHHVPDHAVAIVGSSRGLIEVFPDKTGAAQGNSGGNGAKPSEPTPFVNAAVKFNEQAARMVQLAVNSQRDPITRQYAVLKDAYDLLRKQTE